MEWMMSILPVVTAGVGAGTAWFTMRTAQAKLKREAQETREEAASLKQEIEDMSESVQVSVEALHVIQTTVNKMFQDTNADRFLILVARNGSTNPNRTTAIYEQHKAQGRASISIGAVHRYVDFQLDDHYRKMLKLAENNGAVYFVTDQMPQSALKSIYEYEEVIGSGVHFLMRTPITDQQDRLWYCSVATHNPAGFSNSDITLTKGYIGGVRQAIKTFA